MSRVSVILRAYNLERFVAAAVESVLRQSFGDFELIAVDDGSSDGTAAILDSFWDPRMRVIHQSNAGAAEALNVGIQAANSEYIAILDADDLWHADKLIAHLEYMDSCSSADLTFSWANWIDEEGRQIGLGSRRCHGTFTFRALLEDYVIGSGSTMVFRNDALGRAGPWDPRLTICHDIDLVLRIALLRSANVHAIPRLLTEYRRHRTQISRQWIAMGAEWEMIAQKLDTSPEVAQALRRGRSNMSRYYAFLAYEAGEFREAARILLASLRGSPGMFLTDSRNWKMAAMSGAGVALPSGWRRSLERLAGVELARGVNSR